MKTPWRIQDWNTDRISAVFVLVCLLAVGIVCGLRIRESYRKSCFPRISFWDDGKNEVVLTGAAYHKFSDLLSQLDEARAENAALKNRVEELELGPRRVYHISTNGSSFPMQTNMTLTWHNSNPGWEHSAWEFDTKRVATNRVWNTVHFRAPTNPPPHVGFGISFENATITDNVTIYP